ncbi:MAG: hypothetical protein WBE76_25910 [Terracidiphilus sp.]
MPFRPPSRPEMLRHRIEPIRPLRMHEPVLAEISPLGIPCNISQLILKIRRIPNPMLMETGLPNFT